MKNIRLLIIGLVVGLSVLITAMKVLGQIISAPNQAQILGFGLCSGQPCFSGIIPELTPYSNVQRLVGRRPIRSEPIMRLIVSLDGADVAVIGHADAETVQTIQATLLTLQAPPQAGDVIDVYGPPCRIDFSTLHTVQSAQGIATINLIYPTLIALTQPLNDRLEMTSPVLMINIGAQSGDWCQSVTTGSELSWSGFRSLRRYAMQIP